MEASSRHGSGVGGKRDIEIGRILNEAFRIYGDNLAPLLGSAAVIFLIAGAIRGLLFDSGGIILGLLAAIITVAAQFLYVGFVVKLVEDVRDGRRDFSVGELFSDAAGKILPLVLVAIIAGIIIGVGFLLLIIPGLFLLTYLFVVAPAVVVEDENAFSAMGRSWNLVKGQGLSVFGVIVVTVLIVIGVSIVFSLIGSAFGTGGVIVFSVLSSIVLAPIWALITSVVFFDLGGGSKSAGGSSIDQGSASARV